MPPDLSIVVSIAAILLIGNPLVVCHELGHCAAARFVGLVAERFTIGFGPNLVRAIDRRGTVWSLSALPLGGFVSFASERDRTRSGGYATLRPAARMTIIIVGPAANILVAIGLYGCIFAAQGETTLLPVASLIIPTSAAAKAGLHVGDRILAVSKPIETFADLSSLLRDHPGQTVTLEVARGG
jgi:regulator of sigma E protease